MASGRVPNIDKIFIASSVRSRFLCVNGLHLEKLDELKLVRRE